MTDSRRLQEAQDGGFASSGVSVEALAWGVPAPPRSYWPAGLAVLCSLGLYLLLPDRLVPGPRLLVRILEGLVLAAISILIPHQTTAAAPARRVVAILIISLVTVVNGINLTLLISELLKGHVANGRQLIVSSIAIWLTSVIVFALW